MTRASDVSGAGGQPSRAPSLSARYFRPKAAELDGRLYEWLGVVLFKRSLMRLVRVEPEQPPTHAYRLGGRSLEDVRSFERRTRRSEVIHLIGLSIAALLLALAVLKA